MITGVLTGQDGLTWFRSTCPAAAWSLTLADRFLIIRRDPHSAEVLAGASPKAGKLAFSQALQAY